MDLTTLIGLIVGIALVVNGITIEKLGNFADAPSLLIVVGGTLAAIIASYPLSILMDGYGGETERSSGPGGKGGGDQGSVF